MDEESGTKEEADREREREMCSNQITIYGNKDDGMTSSLVSFHFKKDRVTDLINGSYMRRWGRLMMIMMLDVGVDDASSKIPEL